MAECIKKKKNQKKQWRQPVIRKLNISETQAGWYTAGSEDPWVFPFLGS